MSDEANGDAQTAPDLIIGLTGYTCSGKSQFAKLLEHKGFAIINLGDITRKVAKSKGLTVTRFETWGLFTSEVKQNPEWRVRHIVELVRTSGKRMVALDGIRVKEEVEGLQREFGSRFMLIEVRVSESLRRSRALQRRRDVDPATWDEQTRSRWEQMDKEEVEMVDRLRPLVEATMSGGE